MAKKKQYITNFDELYQALRVVGGVFPHTIEDLNQNFKLSEKEEIDLVTSRYSFEEIWDSPEPLTNQQNSKSIFIKLQQEIDENWGMAARGSHELPEEVKTQMIKNEKSDDQ